MALQSHWLLMIQLLLPVAGAIAVWFIRPLTAARWTAVGVALAGFSLSFLILIPLKWQQGMQQPNAGSAVWQTGRPQQIGRSSLSRFVLAIDGLSYPCIGLTTLICAVACAASLDVSRLPRLYFSLLLLLEAGTLGIFLASNMPLFCGFLFISLIPMVLLIGIWGGERRGRAVAKFFTYMVIGAACLGAVALVHGNPTRAGGWLVGLALVAFLIRLPVVPFHGWMPTVLAEASGPVAALLGSLTPLTGGYGILRIVLPTFSHAVRVNWSGMAALSLVTILYASLRAWSEKDLRRSIAYGSISMTGFSLLGIAAMTQAGVNGALFILLSQGLIVALMLILIGRRNEMRSGTGSIYIACFSVAWFAQMVVPGFVGVLAVLLGTFEATRPDSVLRNAGRGSPGLLFGLVIAASLGLVIQAAYAAKALRTIYAAAPTTESKSTDLPTGDIGFLAPLAAIVILIGALPAWLVFGMTRQAVETILKLGSQ